MKKRKDPNVYPPGLDARKVAEIIKYYEARQDIDLSSDPEHRIVGQPTAWVEVPIALIPKVKRLIAGQRKSA
jgi:hypothetical protein